MSDSIMRQVFTRLPVYAGDVSGVCSALYEYGGMVIMHDPSGCNSTYNTHDETRWDEKESLIFLSGLKESEAVMGSDARLLEDTAAEAKRTHPAFLAVTASPIPWLIGTDLAAAVKQMERRTGIPAFAVGTNGMHDYVCGAGEALLALGKRFLPKEKKRTVTNRLSILGVTPLDFAAPSVSRSLNRFAEEAGFAVGSVWGIGGTMEGIAETCFSSVNLVVSSVGLPLAKYLYETYGAPYVVGLPIGPMKERIEAALFRAQESGVPEVVYLDRTGKKPAPVRIIGEAVCAGSLAGALRLSGIDASAVVTTENHAGLLQPFDQAPLGEKEIAEVLAGASCVIGDPLFFEVTKDCRTIGVPHHAYSGRLFQVEAIDPVSDAAYEEILTKL